MNYFVIYVIAGILGLAIIPLNVECSNRTNIRIRNVTDSENSNLKPQQIQDPFKRDIQKFSRKCGAIVSGEDEEDDDTADVIIPQGHQGNLGEKNAHWAYEGRKASNKGTYPTHYGQKRDGNRRDEDSEEEDYTQDDYSGSNRRKVGHSRRDSRNKGKKRRSSSEYEESKECFNDRRKDYASDRSQWGWSNLGSTSGTRHNVNRKLFGYSIDPYGQINDFGLYSTPEFWTQGGYSIYGGRLMVHNQDTTLDRIKREKRRVDDQSCMSQCVFGYMEMLDDDRIPAETEVVKYFQNNIANTGERVRLIKLARRCFAKLSANENEDGCKFSKDLALCLEIHIKEENV